MRFTIRKYLVTSVAVLALLFVGVGQAKAGPAFTLDNTTGSSLANGPFTLGFQFTANSAITVNALGIFDSSQDGLAVSHDVGLWDMGGNLLASTTVASGTADPLTNQFRYHSITPVTLVAGQTYNIGGLFLDGSDPNTFPGDAQNFVTDPSITFVQNAYVSGGTLGDPTNSVGTDPAYFGPNFLFSLRPGRLCRTSSEARDRR
jgi:hypothetical protein